MYTVASKQLVTLSYKVMGEGCVVALLVGLGKYAMSVNIDWHLFSNHVHLL